MLTRKVLLLSAAIPLIGLPMTALGHADALNTGSRPTHASELLIAQADDQKPTPEDLKKRRQEKKKSRQHDQKRDAGHGKKDEQRSHGKHGDQSKDAHGSKDKDASHRKATDHKPEHTDTQKPAAKGKPETHKENPSAQKAAPKSRKEQDDKSAGDKSHHDKSRDRNGSDSANDHDKTRKNADHDQDKKPSRAKSSDRKHEPDNNGKPGASPQKHKTAAPDENRNKRSGDNRQADHGKPLPDQPTRNVAKPQSKSEKPQRLNVKNGAPVFDSAKDAEKGRGPARHSGKNGRQDNHQRDHQQDNRKHERKPVRVRSAEAEHGKVIKRSPKFRLPQDARITKRIHNRVILNIDNRTIIQNDDHGRLARHARNVRYEQLPGNETRQVVERPNGVRIVTIRNSYGDVVHRSRIDHNGHEVVLIYTPRNDRHDGSFYRKPYVDLPPLRLTEPADDYILDARRADTRQYVRFLEKPPIEPVHQVYSLDQVRYSARLRDIMPRIDLDTITFDTGSSAIGPNQVSALADLGKAINDVIKRDPGQVFMIEGHTDAIGSDESNLVLSDERAESVADALTREFDVPPENLVTQGYGEEYLKVDTGDAERANRRVAVRRITPLIRPVVQNN